MADEPNASPGIEPDVPDAANVPAVPNVARIYDYFLGGHTHYPADIAAARRITAASPQAPLLARAMRRWLVRVVAAMTAEGITQFLDLGAGLPTQDNVHEVAARHHPDTRVVYVDNDPVVLAEGRPLLDPGRSVLLMGDVQDMAAVLDHPDLHTLIDLTAPLGVIVSGVVHFLPETPATAAQFAALRERLAPGSALALNSLVSDADPTGATTLFRLYQGETGRGQLRTADQLRRFFADFTLQRPGLVPLDDWRPDAPVPPSALPEPLIWGGLARKP
ncbi:SAM-dependent methyltransferase [Streptomyces prunicolor]|uniref:SAM-dependent methyltransferase n=1 Tax=Streptomyces prunicolor TaxID=67348 RepID=UPI0037CD5EE0